MEGTVIKDVERISINDFIERRTIPHVHMLHADVQGAELDLLEGAERAISAGKIGYIFISTHGTSVHNACMDFLAKKGFRIIASHTRDESFSTDGLIAARSGNLEGIDEVTISKKHTGILKDLGIVFRHLFARLFGRPTHHSARN
jgi:hypothetical protein